MATGLLALLDDITSILDDVSAMTKIAAGKTAGVLGDDLALNVQQMAEVRAARELPVVWAVAEDFALNKAILVPTALVISAFMPSLVTPLLMLGGAYLCFEGVEKLTQPWLHAAPAAQEPSPSGDERAKVRAAIRTDFVCRPRSSSSRLAASPAAADDTDRGADLHRRADDGRCLRPRRRRRAAGRYRPRSLAILGRSEAAARPRNPDGGAVSDADPVCGRDRGDVPGRRWHPDARVPGRARSD